MLFTEVHRLKLTSLTIKTKKLFAGPPFLRVDQCFFRGLTTYYFMQWSENPFEFQNSKQKNFEAL